MIFFSLYMCSYVHIDTLFKSLLMWEGLQFTCVVYILKIMILIYIYIRTLYKVKLRDKKDRNFFI
jgi:uncharacterized membrane protein YagU involved in acid resistance